MEGFCRGQQLWNSNLTLNNSWPQLTECFQNTVLVWVPCGWLLLTSPLYLYYLSLQNTDPLKLSWLHISKLFLSGLLALVILVEVAYKFTDVDTAKGESHFNDETLSPVIRFVTLVLSCVVIVCERKKGFITSGILFIFWLLQTVAGIVPFYHIIILKTCSKNIITCFLFYFYYGGVLLQLLLFSFAERKLYMKVTDCPELASSFLSRVLYQWTSSLVIRGYKNPLKESDVYDIHPKIACATNMETFLRHWHSIYERFKHSTRKEERKKTEKVAKFNKSDETTPLLQFDTRESGEKAQAKKNVKYGSVFLALFKTFGAGLLLSHVGKLAADVITLIVPQILGELVKFTQDSNLQAWKGYVLAIAMFVLQEMESIIIQKVTQDAFVYASKIRAVLISAVFRKSLKMSNSAKKESTVGEIVNLMSVDAYNIYLLVTYLFFLWSCPFQLVLALYFLYGTVGAAMFAGLGLFVLMIPLNGVILTFLGVNQQKMMECKDKRIRVLGEVLDGIKVLKLYGWEESFKTKIEKIRNSELHFLWKIALYSSSITFSWTAAPYFITLITLVVYVFINPTHQLDAATAFVAISYFNVIIVAVNVLPMLSTEMIRAKVSLTRISKFLSHDELDESSVSHDPSYDSAVVINDATFRWDSEMPPNLKNISLDIPPGSLVAVVGQVGMGKSSLLSAMLGEMEKLQGFVNVRGKVAYVPQLAWIQNNTLRKNILFGRPLMRRMYDDVLSACALKMDLEILPAGDQTEIGEKGINMSGGQKQRISLARAVYNDADIYLMDDPLSAVDSHVGKHIFKEVIGHQGLLKNKTRILVTHGVHWMPMVDRIIVLKDGMISEMGTYDELMSHKGAFAEFLTTYLTKKKDDEEAESEEEDEEVEAVKQHIFQRLVSVHSETETSGDELQRTHILGRIRRESSRTSGTENLEVSGELRQRKMKKRKGAGEDKAGEIKEKPKDVLIEEEDVEVGRVKFSVYISYLKALGLWAVGLSTAMFLLYQGTQMGGNIWLSQWTDDSILSNLSVLPDSSLRRSYNDYYMGIYGLLGLLQGLCILGYAFVIHIRAVSASRILHHRMLSNIVRTPMSFFDTTPLGRIVNRFSLDCDTMDNQLPITLEIWTDMAARCISTVIIISYTTPIFLGPLVPLLIVFLFLQRFFVSTSRQLKRLESKTRSPIYSHFSETISGGSVIRAYGVQDRFIHESEAKVDINQKYLYSTTAVGRWISIRLEFLGAIIVLLAAVLAVATRDSVTGGAVGLSLSYATKICFELTFLTRLTSDLETLIVSVERIGEYAQLTEEAPAVLPDNRPPDAWPHLGCVVFNKYSTRYRPGLDLVLKQINFSVSKGEKVGVVGRTGAGKSSLTLCLFRLIEAAGGEITIDGLDIASIGLHDLRKKLTILPQDPVIFTGSLRSNLDPFNEHTDHEIWTALEHSHLKTFVQSLPDTIYHECGEGGENFSIGQRQLVCLARTLLRNTKILVLDEATAAVDMETDDLIQKTIRSEFKDCTILTIAHRLNTVMDYDRILVLDRGEIAEFDTPASLLQKPNGIFHGMAEDAGLLQ